MINFGCTCSFSLAVYFNFKILQYLKHDNMIETLKVEYKSLQFSMVVQACAQATMLVFPCLGIWISTFLEFKNCMIFGLMIECAPVVTSISTMLSIPEYRRRTKEEIQNILDLLVNI